MASSFRSLKRETWLVRFPNGDVEVVKGLKLDEAFASGLVDARTPVRPVGSSVWTTLDQAAHLSSAPDDGCFSLAPAAIDLEESVDDHPFRMGHATDESILDPPRQKLVRLGRSTGAAMALAGLFAIGSWLGIATGERLGIGARAAAAVLPPTTMTARRVTPAHDVMEIAFLGKRTTRAPRLTDDQMARLDEADAARAWNATICKATHHHCAPTGTSKTPLAPPRGWEGAHR